MHICICVCIICKYFLDEIYVYIFHNLHYNIDHSYKNQSRCIKYIPSNMYKLYNVRYYYYMILLLNERTKYTVYMCYVVSSLFPYKENL